MNKAVTPPHLYAGCNDGGVTHDPVVDTVKGVAIVLMVLGHSPINSMVSHFIYAFHMPLFIFVAGYCFKLHYLGAFKKFGYRRIKGLYWPFLKWNMLFLLLHNLLVSGGVIDGGIYGTHQYICRTAEFLTFQSSEQMLGGFWFLPALFAASIIGWVIIKLCRDCMRYLAFATVMVLLLSIVGLLMMDRFCSGEHAGLTAGLFGEYSLPQLLYYTFFFLCGHLLSKIRFTGNVAVAVSLVVLITLYGVMDFECGMTCTLVWKKLPFAIGALCGIVVIFRVCELMAQTIYSRWFQVVGRRTMDILTWHFLSFKFVSWILISIMGYDMALLTQYPHLDACQWWFWLPYAITGIVLPLFVGAMISHASQFLSVISSRFRQRFSSVRLVK